MHWQHRLQSSIGRSFEDAMEKLSASMEDRQGLGITRKAVQASFCGALLKEIHPQLQAHHSNQIRTHGSRVEVRPHGPVQWELAPLVTAEVDVAGKSAVRKCYRGKCDGVTVDIVGRFKVHHDHNAADA